MTRLRLDYVHEYLDRHGKLRRYFRRPGFKRISLPGVPGSDEFMTAYQLALAGQPPRIEIGARRAYPHVRLETVRDWSAVASVCVLSQLRATDGDLVPSVRMINSRGNSAIRCGRFCSSLLRRDFGRMTRTQGVKPPRVKTDGFHTWTEEEIGQYEARHPIGTKARLALALLLYTAQRRSDVIGMGRQHVRNGAIAVRQQKTGTILQIPVHPKLQEAFAAVPEKQLTFLVTEKGQPFTFAGFGNWFRDRCIEAGLPKVCSAHGLRKAACRRLAEAGCTEHQIAAISGHKSLREVERYTKAANQAELARQAFKKEQQRTNVG